MYRDNDYCPEITVADWIELQEALADDHDRERQADIDSGERCRHEDAEIANLAMARGWFPFDGSTPEEYLERIAS